MKHLLKLNVNGNEYDVAVYAGTTLADILLFTVYINDDNYPFCD